MRLVTLEPSLYDIHKARFADLAREYCAQLEAGNILFFPKSPIEIPEDDLQFLLEAQQDGAGYHKNIAYRPLEDRVTGFVKDHPEAGERLRRIMRRYSQGVSGFLSSFLVPYRDRWRLDYASYRPQEEAGRDLALRKRNDLLHTDAFPTRPTCGDRILRFFNNINPVQTRNWMTTETFDTLVTRFASPAPDAQISLPQPIESTGFLRRAGKTLGLGGVIPSLRRSPYDDFMMRFHNFLKENESFQSSCPKQYWKFPPGSSWMVYTDMVSHAVLSGQYALEQTLLVAKDAMVVPGKSPIGVLERMVGAKLV